MCGAFLVGAAVNAVADTGAAVGSVADAGPDAAADSAAAPVAEPVTEPVTEPVAAGRGLASAPEFSPAPVVIMPAVPSAAAPEPRFDAATCR
jgi:hypothetical protein